MDDWQRIAWIAAGGVYAVGFWVLSARIPAVALALILGLAPFQNDLSFLPGVHFSLSELHLLLSCPIAIWRGHSGGLSWMGPAVWVAWLVTVVLTLPHWRASSAVALVQMGLYWIAAVWVCRALPRSSRDLDRAWRILLGVGTFLASVAILTRSNYFLGLHKNGLGGSLACALVIAVDRWMECRSGGLRWLNLARLGWIGMALILVLSRGAWIASFLGVCWLLVWRGRLWLMLKLGLALVPAMALAWSVLPEESRSYATGFDSGRYNIQARLLNTEYALEEWRSSPWLGVGAGLRKEYDATNVFWLTLAETGPFGVLAFFGVHGFWLLGVWQRRGKWRGTSAGTALGLSGALLLGKLAHGLVDHYWSRGAITVAWGSVGLALGMEAVERKRSRRRLHEAGPQQGGVRRKKEVEAFHG
jgi:hypothetical protein